MARKRDHKGPTAPEMRSERHTEGHFQHSPPEPMLSGMKAALARKVLPKMGASSITVIIGPVDLGPTQIHRLKNKEPR